MNVIIEKSKAKGAVKAPPSKSMAHRYLLCAALSAGESTISGVDFSKDIEATINCLKALGSEIKNENDTVTVKGIKSFTETEITGDLLCNESGSTLRFLIPVCLLYNKKIRFKASVRLLERSLSVYEDICAENGFYFEKGKDTLTLCGKLKSGIYNIPGDISSQFISGMLFALPLLEGESVINVLGKFESESYINLTLKALNDFGIKIERKDNSFYIKGNQKYTAVKKCVEGDYSNAAFLDLFNFLGGEVEISGLDENSLQGDRIYKNYFPMLCKDGAVLDISDCPDLGPVLMAAAAALNGAVLTGTKRLKIKESDRGEAMREELLKFGIRVICEENKITVCNGELKAPDAVLNSHNDHRIVMSLAVLCSLTGGEIQDAQAVEKSFPDYFEKINSLGIKTRRQNGD